MPENKKTAAVPSPHKNKPTFWHWFFGGPDAPDPGWRTLLLSRWWFFHVFVGGVLAVVFGGHALDNLALYILPAISLLGIHICFLTGYFHKLLPNVVLQKYCAQHRNGLCHYLYTYLLAVLITLITFLFWLFFPLLELTEPSISNVKLAGFFLFSMTVREWWHMNMGLAYLRAIIYSPPPRE